MENQAFAVPAPEAPPASPQNEAAYKDKTFIPTETDHEPAISVYEQIKGDPYTVKYFQLEDTLYYLNNPEFTTHRLQEETKVIEEYVIKEIGRRNLIDSVETYQELMSELKLKLNIHPLEKPDVVFRKIFGYIKRVRGKSAYGKGFVK